MQQRPSASYSAQVRSGLIAHTLWISALVLFMAVLQVSVFARYSIFGATPDLMICTVLAIGFFLGRYAGAITGIGAGFLIEALGSVGVSLLPLFYMLLGYIVGHYARAVYPKKYFSYLFYLVFAVLLRAAITLTYISMTYESFHLFKILLGILLPEMADTALAGCVLYLPVRLVYARLVRKK